MTGCDIIALPEVRHSHKTVGDVVYELVSVSAGTKVV